VRVTFRARADRVGDVRRLIVRALAREWIEGPDGRTTTWSVLDTD
jgi:hypothetical protein